MSVIPRVATVVSSIALLAGGCIFGVSPTGDVDSGDVDAGPSDVRETCDYRGKAAGVCRNQPRVDGGCKRPEGYESETETRCDGRDNDCDGKTDERCDRDGDGFCWSEMKVADDRPDDVCRNGGGDCWDQSESPMATKTFPGAAQKDSEGECMLDADNDEYGATMSEIPEDAPANIEPGTDACDSQPRAWSVSACTSCSDTDGDGYWSGCQTLLSKPADCDDSDEWTYPGAAERDAPGECMRDADQDGYGASTVSNSEVAEGTDCWDNEANPAAAHTYPGAAEQRSGSDECSKDADEDGFADANPPQSVSGIYQNGTDCWDVAVPSDVKKRAAATYPGAAEKADTSKCTKDFDDDGFADERPPKNRIRDGTDCNDEDAAVNPSVQLVRIDGKDREKVCDGLDQNCDGTVDNNCDSDGDGYCYAQATVKMPGARSTCPEGGGDCNDNNSSESPGVQEKCDGVNLDCDSKADVNDTDADGWCQMSDQTGWDMSQCVKSDGSYCCTTSGGGTNC